MEYVICKIIDYLSQMLPELSTIDEDYGQLEALNSDDDDSYPLTFPAVLMDTPDTQWSGIAGEDQKGECTIKVKLILDCYHDTHAGAGGLEYAKERMEMNTRLFRTLQGFRPLDDGPLIRTSSHDYTWQHRIKVYETTYTLTITEMFPEREKVKPQRISLRLSVRH